MTNAKFANLFGSGRPHPSLLMVAAFSFFILGLPPAQAQLFRSLGQFRLPSMNTPPSTTATQLPADFIVAVVNSEPITNNELRSRLARIETQLAGQGSAPPRAELMRELLERMIVERTQLQLARTLGIKIDESAVDQAVTTVARQNQMTMDELRRRMVQDGVVYSQFRVEIREELTLQRLRERELEPRVKVTEQDIDQFMREQEAGGGALEINVAQILIAVPENASASQVSSLQAKAVSALERARTSADFAKLVNELSDAPDRAGGGQMGLRTVDRYPPLFVDAVRDLAVGGVVGPIRSGAGFHILKLLDKKRSGVPGLDLTQTHARHILLRTTPQLDEQAAKQRLSDFKRRVLSGQADFAALAREYSADGSAKDGGDLGWAAAGMFVPEFEQTMSALAPGEIADPLVSRFGVHLIQVLERRQGQLTLREQREIVRNVLREKKMDEAYVIWAQELRGRAYVEYREPPA